MIKNKIHLLYLEDGQFAVGFNMDVLLPGGQERFAILKSFDNPSSTTAYAAGILDGWQFATKEGGLFEPVDFKEIKTTPQFRSEILKRLEKVCEYKQ